MEGNPNQGDLCGGDCDGNKYVSLEKENCIVLEQPERFDVWFNAGTVCHYLVSHPDDSLWDDPDTRHNCGFFATGLHLAVRRGMG